MIYKVLKEGYPATYNFKDEADGTSGNDIGGLSSFTTDDTNGALTIVSSQGDHKKVAKISGDGDNGADTSFRIDFVNQTSGDIEYHWKYIDNGVGYTRLYLYDEGWEQCVYLYLNHDNNRLYWFYGDGLGGAGSTSGFMSMATDTYMLIRIHFDCATDTYSLWVDGILKVDDEPFYANHTATTINLGRFNLNGGGGANALESYIDAIGYSWDTNYNVGDNIHWRNYKDSMAQANFEGEDCGTTSTSITFIDSDNNGEGCSVEIIPSFDEHKKIMDCYDNGAGAIDIRNTLSAVQTSGVMEYKLKSSNINYYSWVTIWSGEAEAIQVGFHLGQIYVYQSGIGITNIIAATHNTWYDFKLEFECGAEGFKGLAADTLYVWIDNVRYGPYLFQTAVANIDTFSILTDATQSGYHVYLDAVGYSWETDYEIADNRLLEYHSLSKTDITSKCSKCTITKAVTLYSTASLETIEIFGDEHYLQIFDENSDLRFIGNRFKDIDIGISINGYTFQTLNKVDLEGENSYSASAAEDVNASLLGILTNVGQADGRLIYYTEDDPAGNLKPNYRNKPRHMITRILAIRGGKKCIIKASGKVFLDDDANPDNGAATITGTSSELMGIPLIDRSSHQINYVEVRGGIDPSTGKPFSGVSQDASAQTDGTGLIPYYKRLRELQSDADCLSVATAIRTGTNFTPQIIRVRLRGIYADPGEIINFAYSNKSFTATNCYVDSVRMNVLNNVCNYSLNTGISDPITFNSPGYTMADETADDIAEILYNTDINTVYLRIVPSVGATEEAGGVKLDAVNEMAIVFWYTPPNIDTSRVINIYVQFYRVDANADTITIAKDLTGQIADGGTDTVSQWAAEPDTLDACAGNREMAQLFILTAANNYANYRYTFSILMNEAGRSIYIRSIAIVYYIKRSI